MSEKQEETVVVAPRVSVWAAATGCIVVAAIIIFALMAMAKLRPQAKKSTFEKTLPSVEIHTVAAPSSPPVLECRALLESRRVVTIASEVQGQIIEISPHWKKGGTIREGDLIARLDDSDYQAMREKMAAAVAQAQENLILEETQAAMSLAEWDRVSKEPPSVLTKREPQLNRARAILASAVADFAKAERDLQRTKIVAPFRGRVRSAAVEVGSITSMGMVLGELYSDQEIEIRVPIRLKEKNDIDFDRMADVITDESSNIANYQAKLMHFEGEVNRDTHTLNVILQIVEDHNQPSPTIGTFSRIMLPLKSGQKRFPIPRQALNDGSYVHVVNEQNQIEAVKVKFIRGDRDTAYIEGLEVGQRIVLTRLQAVLPMMKVRIISDL